MIGTYDDLKAVIARTANRKDAAFAAQVPDFIALAEAEMRRDINARGEVYTLDTEIDDDMWPLPCGFDGIVSINADGDRNRKINFVSSDVLDQQSWPDGNAYTVSGNYLYFGRSPGFVRLRYRTLFEPLSSRNRCNWLLMKHPDVYLYGALKHSAPYLEDDQRLGTWQTLYANGVAAVNKQAIEQKYGGPLRIASDKVV